MDGEFVKQFSGSGAANLASVVLFLVVWVIRNKCKHSRCKGHSICCDCEIKDSNDEEGTEGDDIERGITVRKTIKSQLQELQRKHREGLRGSD